MENAVITMNLSKSYGGRRALHACCMHVPAGAVYGLVGPGGAGKTTLLRLLGGLQRPTIGSYTLLGARCGTAAMTAVRGRVAAVIGTPPLCNHLTVRENVQMTGRLTGTSQVPPEDILEMVDLTAASSHLAGSCTPGARQRLSLGCALAGGPDLVMLDDPMRGLNADDARRVRELITRISVEHGTTFLVTGRRLSDLKDAATHYGFLCEGRLVREMSAAELAAPGGPTCRIEVPVAARAARALAQQQVACLAESPTVLRVRGCTAQAVIAALGRLGIPAQRCVEAGRTARAAGGAS